MANLIARFIKEDEGQDLIEYALVGGLMALAAVASITLAGTELKRIYGAILAELAKITVV